jgi:hypothetical protein
MPEVHEVVGAVARVFAIDPHLIQSRDRHAGPAEARAVVMYLLRERGRTLQAVGAAVGRDHATAGAGHAKVKARMRVDRQFAALVQDAEQLARVSTLDQVSELLEFVDRQIEILRDAERRLQSIKDEATTWAERRHGRELAR